jgi:hypothetical protein
VTMRARTVISARQTPFAPALRRDAPVRLRIAELCESLLLALVRLLLPARGRHRAAGTVPAVAHPPPPGRRHLAEEPLVMDTRLVRPYLSALEVSA